MEGFRLRRQHPVEGMNHVEDDVLVTFLFRCTHLSPDPARESKKKKSPFFAAIVFPEYKCSYLSVSLFMILSPSSTPLALSSLWW